MPKGVRESLESRFWLYVSKTDDGCWEWIGSRNSKGYGQLKYRGRNLKTHRVSWELHFGPIRNDLFVCHKCDNPPCVRPDHLFLGTHVDNMADMIRKHRAFHPPGISSSRAKLTMAVVAEIRCLYASGMFSHSQLAARYDVNKSNISRLLSEKSYKDGIIR